MLSEKKDLWKLVQKHISDEEPEMKKVAKSKKESEIIEKEINEETETYVKPQIKKETKENTIEKDFATINLLEEGIFAGFMYIFGIMIVLGLLSIPGSITAAIGGFLGGRKAGNPARALTAAMLPFLVIATIYFLASSGALPPGSGPNDVATEIGNMINFNTDKAALGPISKMPDSTSSVFVSVVTFAFIGGLVNLDNKKTLS
tara:strand:+ start:491 stop:1099 length:609 start_codon:yes stop_codon:yes gene_type:complete